MNTRRAFEYIITLFVLTCLITQTACDNGQRHVSGVDSLGLEFRSNRSKIQVGESLHMQFWVTNFGQNYIVIESKDTPVMDIVVEGEDRQVLLTWSSQNPDKVSNRIEWKPGETHVIELVWIPRQEDLQFGRYYDIFLSGRLNENSKFLQSAGVRICASNFCLPPR